MSNEPLRHNLPVDQEPSLSKRWDANRKSRARSKELWIKNKNKLVRAKEKIGEVRVKYYDGPLVDAFGEIGKTHKNTIRKTLELK